uniref:Uncharacterized protein n=1 Tax=viral metagenome TaxID=1070528 RepID=A0A6M3K0V8_9ZZZZ
MADFEDAVRTRLTAHEGTAALISTRAYFGSAPQGATFPCSVVQQISAPRLSAMSADVDKVESRQQVRACAKTRAEAKALGDQHRAALQRYSGTSASVVIHDCFLVNEIPGYEPETKLYTLTHDFMVWGTE